MDQLKAMAAFMKVVDTASFTAAADELDMSRPMVSKYIQSLEDDLGVRLLNRTTRSVALTEAGYAFHTRCESIVESIDIAFAEASRSQLAPKGKLRIGASIQFGVKYLVPALAFFQEKYEKIEIELILNDRRDDIINSRYDLVVRIGHLQDSRLVAKKLSDCPLYICAAPSYLEKFGVPTTPADLKKHNCLLYTEYAKGSRWTLIQNSENISIELNSDFQSNHGEALVQAAIRGRGIILEPGFAVCDYIKSGQLVQILLESTPSPMGIFAVYPQKKLLPQKTSVVIEELRSHFKSIEF